MEPKSHLVRQILSPARAATRERLIDSTVSLATEGGYDAVTIRQIAARAGVSVPTAYQHASSKDQLLVEALMALGRLSTESVRHGTLIGETPADRLVMVFGRILREASRKPLLYQAMYRAYVACSPAQIASDPTVGFGPEKAKWIGETLRAGDTQGNTDGDIESASRILSCLFLGAMVGVAAGRDADEVLMILEEATRKLLP
ncbi:TetR/AcrR family transcriptional regulator [Rhodococcus sp. ARC_M6]|uniref:TetR/AcrR family transcriptional regulator n=1 Tax=Rhodococcus sp. ARC_M6 TaxID=2928852 RepID=UPI001FB3A763|nr:TetR/AcrR family transcriptional regulator [Rhodococcus sp. ARC_M6]MCJ0904766.1 TetR family transcriptional regulator [Rhodococcus sp. ARC_M6]